MRAGKMNDDLAARSADENPVLGKSDCDGKTEVVSIGNRLRPTRMSSRQVVDIRVREKLENREPIAASPIIPTLPATSVRLATVAAINN